MVREHRADDASEWAAIESVAAKLGVAAPETLRKWIRRAEVAGRQRAGVTTGRPPPSTRRTLSLTAVWLPG